MGLCRLGRCLESLESCPSALAIPANCEIIFLIEFISIPSRVVLFLLRLERQTFAGLHQTQLRALIPSRKPALRD